MNQIKVTYLDGAKVEIIGDDTETKYNVYFYNNVTGELIYQIFDLKSKHWTAANIKYFVPWRIVVEFHTDTRIGQDEYFLDLKDKNVLISFASKSLGDTVSWIAQVSEFQQKHNCTVSVSTFWNELFVEAYPNLKFIPQNTVVANCYASYVVGAWDRDFNRNKNDWRFIPLQQIASDILGLSAKDIKPIVTRSKRPNSRNRPYVCISEFSTWYAKQWLYPDGWKELICRIKDQGYDVISISKESTNLDVIKENNNPIIDTVKWLQYAEAFIGPSCGLSVLAWALNIPTCIVSGCTGVHSEFTDAVRVANTSVCHGCMSDQKYTLDRGNWKFCPNSQDFICSRSITVDMVWEKILPILNRKQRQIESAKKRILYLTPHCSTGGGPKYLQRCVEELKDTYESMVVEYQNISDTYVVQRNAIKQMVGFNTLGVQKLSQFKEIVSKFNPNIIHLHELPEHFQPSEDGFMEWLFRVDRPYKIIDTIHCSALPARQHIPDAFSLVSSYHVDSVSKMNIPFVVIDYTLKERQRPDRTEALQKLGLDLAKKHILNVGLFSPWKNQAKVFEIAKQMPDIQFHFVGNTADNFKYYWEPLLSNKPENCIVWGERSDVDDFYASMDAFLFTSTTELNPLVVKEALAWRMSVYMWDLPTYCGAYSGNKLITFIDENVEKTVKLLRQQFPVEINMGAELQKVYALIGL